MRPIITARFWVWHNEGFVRISLKDGQELTACDGWRTDEGHTSEATTWSRDGDEIKVAYDSWGVDCDGRHSWHSDRYCSIHELDTEIPYSDSDGPDVSGIMIPNWQKESVFQRDYSAEMAGY